MSSALRTLMVLAMTAITLAPAFGQDGYEYSAEAERLFRAGLSDFSAGRNASAVSEFQKIIVSLPNSHRITAAYVMCGKALFEEREFLEAGRTLRSFLAMFPTSTYIADAHLTLANVYERIGRRQDALREFHFAWQTLPVPRPQNLLESLVASTDSVLDQATSPLMTRRMLAEATVADERAYFWVKIGEKELEQENIVGAAVAVDTLDRYYPGSPFGVRTALIRSRLTGSTDVKLLALLPLMRKSPPSAAREVANDVYEGILYAVERYGSEEKVPIKVGLETRDTERSAELAGRLVRETAKDKKIVAILGPIFSTTTSAAAAVAQTEGVVLVSPTANANGIAASGQYVFQANPDYGMRGRAMARYAVLVKGLKVLATLAPQDTYNKSLAEAFIREAEALGARVVTQAWYPKGSTDLKSQFVAIRQASMMENAEPMVSFAKVKTNELLKLLEYGIPKKRLDSLLEAGVVVKGTDLFGPNARSILDSLGLTPEFDMTRLDSLEYAASGVQAVYVPIGASSEVGVVSAQMVYYNIQAQLLGSGEWNDLQELDEHKRYCTGLVFDSDTDVDTTGGAYRQFAAGFAARFKRPPTKNVLFGYDTADLVLQQIRNGAATRQSLARNLSYVKDYRGLHSRIGFGADRVNYWLFMLQYDGKAIRRIDEVGIE
jgi:ABC-type branched-subunit amino acid transport system substrate-binding protein